MSDPLKKVKPGDPLAIPAATFNTFVDAAQDYLRRQRDQSRQSKPAGGQAGMVLIRNDSGADCPRFGVLGIDDVVIDPADDEDAFAGRVVLAGVTPDVDDHTGRFVVTAEPIAAGEIGRAYADGVFPANVNVFDTTHKYADVADGQIGYLASGTSGAIRILWAQSGTGERLAVVRMDGPAGEAAVVPTGTIVLWYGEIVNIPVGWVLCDGQYHEVGGIPIYTPDLRDRFVIGAGGQYSRGQTGGSATHAHAIEVDCEDPPEQDAWIVEGTYQTRALAVLNKTILPPYYALAYIMKL